MSLDKLYGVLFEKELVTKSFDEFKQKYSDPAYQQRVYEVATDRDLYTKSFEEFQSQYTVDEQPLPENITIPDVTTDRIEILQPDAPIVDLTKEALTRQPIEQPQELPVGPPDIQDLTAQVNEPILPQEQKFAPPDITNVPKELPTYPKNTTTKFDQFFSDAIVKPVNSIMAGMDQATASGFGMLDTYAKKLSEMNGGGNYSGTFNELSQLYAANYEKHKANGVNPDQGFVGDLARVLNEGVGSLAIDLPIIAQTGLMIVGAAQGGAEGIQEESDFEDFINSLREGEFRYLGDNEYVTEEGIQPIIDAIERGDHNKQVNGYPLLKQIVDKYKTTDEVKVGGFAKGAAIGGAKGLAFQGALKVAGALPKSLGAPLAGALFASPGTVEELKKPVDEQEWGGVAADYLLGMGLGLLDKGTTYKELGKVLGSEKVTSLKLNAKEIAELKKVFTDPNNARLSDVEFVKSLTKDGQKSPLFREIFGGTGSKRIPVTVETKVRAIYNRLMGKSITEGLKVVEKPVKRVEQKQIEGKEQPEKEVVKETEIVEKAKEVGLKPTDIKEQILREGGALKDADGRVVGVRLVDENGNTPKKLYRVMSEAEYDNAIKDGKFTSTDGRLHLSAKPATTYLEPEGGYLVEFNITDKDQVRAKQSSGDEVFGIVESLPTSSISGVIKGTKAEIKTALDTPKKDSIPAIKDDSAVLKTSISTLEKKLQKAERDAQDEMQRGLFGSKADQASLLDIDKTGAIKKIRDELKAKQDDLAELEEKEGIRKVVAEGETTADLPTKVTTIKRDGVMFDVWRVGDKLELRSKKKDSDGNPVQTSFYSEKLLEEYRNRSEGGRKAYKTAKEFKTIIPKSALDELPALKAVFGVNVGSDYSGTFDGVLIGNSGVWNEGKEIVTNYDETIIEGYRDALGLADDVEISVDDIIEQAQQEVELYRERGSIEKQLAEDLENRMVEELKQGEMTDEELERLGAIATEEELQREIKTEEAEIGLLETEALENEKPVVQEPAPKKPKQAPEKPTAPNVPPKPPKPPEDAVTEPEDMGKSLSPDVQKNIEEARGVRKESFVKRHKEKFVQIKNDFTRHFPDIDPKKYPNISNTMRVAETAREGAVAKTQNRLSDILGGMTEPEYQNFTMQLILPDMLADIKKFKIQLEDGEKFNFGYESAEQIQKDLDHFKKTAPKKVKDALKQREETLNSLRKEMVDLKILPKEVLDQPYFHRQVLEHMEMKGLPTGSTAKGLRLGPKSWTKKRVGSLKDFNTDYIEAEYEVLAQGYESVAVKKALDSIGKEANIAKETRAESKEKDVDVSELTPEGYVWWSPQIGTRWFQAATVDQKVMQQIIKDGEGLVGKADFNKIFAATSKELWLIPEDLANALNNFKKYETKNVYTGFSLAVRNKWKQWKLLNPKAAIKYNINNASGDTDIVVAYDYKIITEYSRQAAKDLWAYTYNRKKLSKAKLAEIERAMDESVLNSGITMQEIPDLADNQALDSFMRKLVPGGDKGSKIGKLPVKYWQGVKNLTNFRENVLRLAALRSFQDKIAKGLKPYGASNRIEIDGIKDDYRRSAKLARELVGDYGNLTAAGEMIRQHMIYFYSWMEINAPRYVRLMRNAPYEQIGMKQDKEGTWVPKGSSRAKIAGVLGKKAAFGTAKAAGKATAAYAGLTASAFAMYSLVSLWNETMFPDEAEELSRQDAGKFGIILGRYPDGKIRTLKFQGALTDALGWFALDDPKATYKALRDDEMTATELLKEMVVAGPERLFNASMPFVKMGFELVTGKKLFPNPFKPSPIRDKVEHLSRLFDLDGVYRDVAGKPSPDKTVLEHVFNTIQGLAFYSTDPGELAYWSAKSDMFKFQEMLGIEPVSITPTKKSNALYYYKKSMQVGDLKAGLKYYQKYLELGGTEEGLENSIELLAPEMALREELRDSYINTLSNKQLKTLLAAQLWYEKTYK